MCIMVKRFLAIIVLGMTSVMLYASDRATEASHPQQTAFHFDFDELWKECIVHPSPSSSDGENDQVVFSDDVDDTIALCIEDAPVAVCNGDMPDQWQQFMSAVRKSDLPAVKIMAAAYPRMIRLAKSGESPYSLAIKRKTEVKSPEAQLIVNVLLDHQILARPIVSPVHTSYGSAVARRRITSLH